MCFLFSLALATPAVSAATKDTEPPDKEMLRMLEFLRDMEIIRNLEMMKDMGQLERNRDQATREPGTSSSATAKKAPLK